MIRGAVYTLSSIAGAVWSLVTAVNRGVNAILIDGVAWVTHAAGMVPGDVRAWLGGTPNALQSGRVDCYVGAAAAGAISIRASNVQRGVATAAATTADVPSISAVTMTRAPEHNCGHTQNTTNAPLHSTMGYLQLVSTTALRFTVNTVVNNQVAAAALPEYY